MRLGTKQQITRTLQAAPASSVMSPELHSSISRSCNDFFSSTRNAALMLLGPEWLFKAGSVLCSWHPQGHADIASKWQQLAWRGRSQRELCGAQFFPALFAAGNCQHTKGYYLWMWECRESNQFQTSTLQLSVINLMLTRSPRSKTFIIFN